MAQEASCLATACSPVLCLCTPLTCTLSLLAPSPRSFCVMACSLIFVLASAKASLSLHGDAIKQLLYAPIHWHDATPSGRTLSRFSADMGIIDGKLSQDLDTFMQMTFFAVVLFVYIIATSWVLIIVGVVLIVGASASPPLTTLERKNVLPTPHPSCSTSSVRPVSSLQLFVWSRGWPIALCATVVV